MTAKELKKKYLDFFVKKGHKKLPNASLIPENDPTALFINSGMHPLVPYLLGEPHPLGKRLTSSQRCVRTVDIENVGDTFHHTLFEMLGNWSLGDPASPDGIGQGGYWKKEALSWSWEFLTKELSLDPKRIFVTCFSGDKDLPKDEEAAEIWRSLDLPPSRIFFLGIDVNWWAVGKTGPCGPCSEMYYDTGRKPCSLKCQPGCDCDKYIEIWNDVFMSFNRKPNGKLEKLKQQNIDTGMGVERTTAVLQGTSDNYQTELFTPIIREIESISRKKYSDEFRAFRVIADHLRAATFMIADGVVSSNVERGYILRRLIRRSIVSGRSLKIQGGFTVKVAKAVLKNYQDEYPHLKESKEKIEEELRREEERFMRIFSPRMMGKLELKYQQIASRGLELSEVIKETGSAAFDFCTTHGVPPEICLETARKIGLVKTDHQEQKVKEVFDQEMDNHRKKSRASLDKKFSGGLADHSEVVTKLHTATHLLHQALRDVLGKHIKQVGSNITPDRLRFDFIHPKKLSETEIKQIEEMINKQIKADLPVKVEMMTLDEVRKREALAFFTEKYRDKVKVYSIGDPSTDSTGASTEASAVSLSTSSSLSDLGVEDLSSLRKPEGSSEPRTARPKGSAEPLSRMSSPQADLGGRPYSCEVCGGPHVSSTGKIGGVRIVKEKPIGVGRRRIYAVLD